MALIKCPKCGKEYSDRAKKCPQCGISTIEAKSLLIERKEERNEWWRKNKKWVVTSIILPILCFAVYIFLVNRTTIKATCARDLSVFRFRESVHVIIPDGTTFIDDCAFMSCTTLKSVTIPNSVTNIGDWAFYGCSGLTNVVLNSSAIASKTYSRDWNIGRIFGAQVTEYILGDGVSSIGERAFEGCSGLTSITIPNSVTNIEADAFDDCSNLKSVHIKDLNAWCNIAFKDDGANPLMYAHHLFLEDSEITDLIIPNSVSSIGERAFGGCSGLISITIPNSVTNIEAGAFDDCSNLKSVHIKDLNAWCNIAFKDDGANPLMYAHHLFLEDSEITDLIIPNSVSSIGERAFEGCSGLISITIPNSVSSIGERAFEGCSGLISITIPNSVTSINYSAFSGCTSLTTITIPNSVTSIGYGAFSGCTSLPIEDNVRYADTYLIGAVDKTKTSYNIKSGTRFIGSSAFSGCTSLTSVTIPNSVISISSSAFSGCTSLTTITIPNSVTSINYCTFCDCSNLASINIPNSVTSIGLYAFYGCSGLTNVTIPNSVTIINDKAFLNCKSMNIKLPKRFKGNVNLSDCRSVTYY